MAKRVRNEDAPAEYLRRHKREWREDVSWGLLMAMTEVVNRHVVRGAVAMRRREVGGRQITPEAMPEWCVAEAKRYVAQRGSLPPAVGPQRLVQDPRSIELALRLSKGASEDWSEQERRELLEHAKMLERRFALLSKTPRSNPTEYNFFVGVRISMVWKYGLEPTPSQLSLLGAASGVMPFEKSLDHTTGVWRKRMPRWRARMDGEFAWRSPIGRVPHSAERQALI